MSRVVLLVMLSTLTVALAISGVRGVVRRRVPTRLKKDVIGPPAVVAGVALLAVALAVGWVLVMLVREWRP
jgi:hypothetical protein